MKKALSEVGMSKSESKAIRQTMKQGILNIQPFLVSVAEISSEQSILYATMSDVQPSKQKNKSERLVEAVSTKIKRVKQQATGPRKIQKILLTIESSDEEDEEQETKQAEKVTPSKKVAKKSWQPWKPKIERRSIYLLQMKETLFR